MITHRVRKPKGGDPVLTITIVGYHDMYRFAFNLLHDQVEFAAVGRKVMAYVAGKLGRDRFATLDQMLNNGRVVSYGWQRRVRGD